MICHSCNLSKSDYQYLVYVYRWLSLSRWVRHRCIIAWRRHLQVEGKLPSDNSILPPWRRKAGATKYEHRARLASLSTNSTLAGTVRDARAINVRRYTNDGDFRMRRSVVLTTFDLVWRTDGRLWQVAPECVRQVVRLLECRTREFKSTLHTHSKAVGETGKMKMQTVQTSRL